MANWALPELSSNYTVFLTAIGDRLNDLATGFYAAPSNQPDKTIKFDYLNNYFSRYSSGGGTWSALTLAIAGGGTGANTASGARTAVGFGSLAVQDSNALSVSGGTISGLSSLGVSGAGTFGGKLSTTSNATDSITCSGGITAAGVGIINTSGKIPAISSSYFTSLSGANLTSIPNSATTATSANTAGAIVARDGSGHIWIQNLYNDLTYSRRLYADELVVTSGGASIAGTITGLGFNASAPTLYGLQVAGNIIVNTSGKIPAISSTYFSDLSGANLTGIPTSALALVSSASFPNAIIVRDASENFSAQTIVALNQFAGNINWSYVVNKPTSYTGSAVVARDGGGTVTISVSDGLVTLS